MDFTFSEDQLAFQASVQDFLSKEVRTEDIRAGWESDSGRSTQLWQQLSDMGLPGMLVPEEFGGLGMNELDFVLLAQECGYVALAEPLVHVALVASATLQGLGNDDLNQQWLPKIANGEAKVVVGFEDNLWVEDAHIADLLLLQRGGELHALNRDQVELTYNKSVDPSRKLFSVQWTPTTETRVASGEDARNVLNGGFNRGALACAAQALGLTQRMIDLSVAYTTERHQFGKPIGSFQAVKHHMANIAYQLEYAKAPLARAAYSLAHGTSSVDRDISHAKLVACEVAQLAAKNSIQVHGAMGYTWELDLHIFVKKAWALCNTYGDAAFHKNRVAEFLFAPKAQLGGGKTFTD